MCEETVRVNDGDIAAAKQCERQAPRVLFPDCLPFPSPAMDPISKRSRWRTKSFSSSTTPLLHHQPSSTSIMSRSSSTKMPPSSPQPDRLNSLTGSLKKTLLGGSDSAKSTATPSPAIQPIIIPLDPLPTDPRELEGLLNRQLSALDHIRRTVKARNEDIKNYGTRAIYYHEQHPTPGKGFLKQLDVEMDLLKQQRDAFIPIVKMRHDEIVRMAEWRKKIDEERGFNSSVYEMYLGLLHLETWEELFAY